MQKALEMKNFHEAFGYDCDPGHSGVDANVPEHSRDLSFDMLDGLQILSDSEDSQCECSEDEGKGN